MILRHSILVHLTILFFAGLSPIGHCGPANASWGEILTTSVTNPDCIAIAGTNSATSILTDTNDFPVVQLAAGLFAGDVERVNGQRPSVRAAAPKTANQIIIVGTLGHNALIQRLAEEGKLKNLDGITNRWEATLMQIVNEPFPGVDKALVIVGSDRRGAAYGLMRLSEKIGVSPWYWWADVPVQHHSILTLKVTTPQTSMPGVKYRGFFINDEDWGLQPWAAKTFDPQFKNIGPKTYEKVFELMLRLRLNYLWPAMHACSTEFGAMPENVTLADRYGIVAGSSHCEPMLFNNVHWRQTKQGPWNYALNHDAIHSTWENNVKARSAEEAVWTLGMRGIHDAGMETPPEDIPGKIKLMTEVFHDQRELLDHYVTNAWGPIAQCFVPYKEVLPIYDAGLKVPDDVTLVWVDDNFGYIRRLSNPAERQRAGGAGVYWHTSYYGGPHSYTWINTTAPALMWEELHKAWENDARTLWVINVGDIKPMEIGISYFARLAWSPDGFPLASQRQFLTEFVTENFGPDQANPMVDLLMEFYRLGTVRKPELMDRKWAMSLSPSEAQRLANDYTSLRHQEQALYAALPAAEQDAFTELVGFPIQVLGTAGLIFLADRDIQYGIEVAAHTATIEQLRKELESDVLNFNTQLAGGKWNRMMPGLVTGKDLVRWNSQVRWPWGEPAASTNAAAAVTHQSPDRVWRNAATADHQSAAGAARWCQIEGLGPAGSAMAVLPASLSSSWQVDDTNAPNLEFNFTAHGGDSEALIDFLPTFRIYPGLKLRIVVSVDETTPTIIEVPGSSGAENENGTIRSRAVQDNYVRAHVPLPALPNGPHTLTIRAADPGIVIERVALP